MSETEDESENLTEEELLENYDDEPQYTVRLNDKEYALNEELRERIQERARREYRQNVRFSCWWKTASQQDAEESDIHKVGDPILVIETEGRMVPWENLDQLELEEETEEAFSEFEPSGGNKDVNEGGGVKTIDRDDAATDGSSDKQEIGRTHFDVTPQDFQEVPSPDGEDPTKVPPKPESFDEPTMVSFIPDNPEIEHTWAAGEAITGVVSWVEWNVQAKADQPRLTEDKDTSHDHWESILKMDDCGVVEEFESDESGQTAPRNKDEPSGQVERKGEDWYDGDVVGDRWNV